VTSHDAHAFIGHDSPVTWVVELTSISNTHQLWLIGGKSATVAVLRE
jgi:hypothetical protein